MEELEEINILSGTRLYIAQISYDAIRAVVKDCAPRTSVQSESPLYTRAHVGINVP